LISKGFLPQAKKHARKVIEKIVRLDPRGETPIIGLEPSEIYTLRDEYIDFYKTDENIHNIAARAYMLDEYLVRFLDKENDLLKLLNISISGKRVLLHGHCYQKTQPPAVDGFPVGIAATKYLLNAVGVEVEEIKSGCCGMAGSFGYEAEHYEVSMRVGEMSLFPAVRDADNNQTILAAGVSCRTQIEEGTDRIALHPIEFMNQQLLKN
jgi:Fe-S oxidoreductase